MSKSPTQKELRQRHKALADVRGAIRGWAFTHEDFLPAKVRQAEAIVANLPRELRVEGDKLIQPLRDAVRRNREAQVRRSITGE